MPNYSCIQLLITQKPSNPISYFAKKRHILSVGFVEIEKVEEIGEKESIFFAAFSVFVICDFDVDLFYMSFYFELVNCWLGLWSSCEFISEKLAEMRLCCTLERFSLLCLVTP